MTTSETLMSSPSLWFCAVISPMLLWSAESRHVCLSRSESCSNGNVQRSHGQHPSLSHPSYRDFVLTCRSFIIGDHPCQSAFAIKWLTTRKRLPWAESSGRYHQAGRPARCWYPLVLPCSSLMGKGVDRTTAP